MRPRINSECKWPDCTERCRAQGYCKLHYWRARYWKLITLKKRSRVSGEGTIRKSGYKWVQVKGRKIAEHRLIMEQHLGRKLDPSEEIHHINRNRLDNRIENLVVVGRREHALIHMYKHPVIDGKKQCSKCGIVKPLEEYYPRPEVTSGTRSRCKYCFHHL